MKFNVSGTITMDVSATIEADSQKETPHARRAAHVGETDFSGGSGGVAGVFSVLGGFCGVG